MRNKPEESDGSRVVFVTGSNGSLGKELIRALIKEGNEVRGLITAKENINELPTGVIPIVGNLSDTHVLNSACKGADAVFHLAAIIREFGHSTDELMRVNVQGTMNVLEACKNNKVRHFIYTSTIDVYGRKRKEVLRESAKPMPTDKYGYSKMLAEQEIMESNVPYTIFRIATIYGPGFETSFFKVFKAITEGKIAIVGNGKNHLAIVHIDDVIQALLLAENSMDSVGKVYNLGDGVAYTQEALIQLAAKMLNAEKPDRHVNELIVRMLARQRNLESDELRFLTSNRVLDIGSTKSELGFKPSVTIDKGGQELVSMFLSNARRRSL